MPCEILTCRRLKNRNNKQSLLEPSICKIHLIKHLLLSFQSKITPWKEAEVFSWLTGWEDTGWRSNIERQMIWFKEKSNGYVRLPEYMDDSANNLLCNFEKQANKAHKREHGWCDCHCSLPFSQSQLGLKTCTGTSSIKLKYPARMVFLCCLKRAPQKKLKRTRLKAATSVDSGHWHFGDEHVNWCYSIQ